MKLLVPVKGSVQNPTFSPDGKAFLFTRYRGGYAIGAADLYVADVRDRERVTRVTNHELDGATNINATGYRSTWTPKGWIAFATDYGEPSGHTWPHLIRPNGSGLRRLPGASDEHSGGAPSISPTGEEFVYARRAGGNGPGQIVTAVVDAAFGYGEKVISEAGQDASNPSWSPDGSSIVWQATSEQGSRIVYHDLASGDSRYITVATQNFFDPSWCPESDRIVCGGENGIYEVSLIGNGRAIRPVEHPRTYHVGKPSWSPDITAKQRRLMCEGTDRDAPDGGPGTWLEIY